MTLQLTYDLTTDPNPLEVDRPDSTLIVIGSATRASLVSIDSITISIPIGTGSGSLADSSAVIAAAGPDGWTISGNTAQGTFTFTPPTEGDNGISGGLVFAFSNITVNQTEGTAQVWVTENSRDSEALSISKFPAGFERPSFTAHPTEINAGDAVTLSWAGTAGYTYAITPADLLADKVDPTTNKGSVQTKALSENTIFTLSVSNGDNQGSWVTQEFAGAMVTPPTIDDFTINGGSKVSDVNLGDTLKLGWKATNADRVLVLANARPVGWFDASNTEATLRARVGGRYRAVAYYGKISGGIHSPPSDPVRLKLNPPTATLTVTPATIYADYNSVTLDWTTRNATSATLQKGTESGEHGVSLSASDYAVYPQSTTQYKITASYNAQEALGTMGLSAREMPKTMLIAVDAAENSDIEDMVDAPKDEATKIATMKPCPLQVFTDTFHPGGSNKRVLDTPVTTAVSYIAAFNNTYADGKTHNLYKWQLQGKTDLDASGTTLTTSCGMYLEDDDDHKMSSSATLSTVTVCLDEDDGGAYLFETEEDWQQHSFTLPGTGYTSLMTGLSYWSFSAKGEDDGEVNRFSVYATPPSPDDFTPDAEAGTTGVSIGFEGQCTGEESYYWGLRFGPLATIDTPAGSGFGLAVASEGTAKISFPQPVAKAYTFLCKWQDDGDGDHHSVQLLQSDSVDATTTTGGQDVTLSWHKTLWDNGKSGPWTATRQVIVLACYGETSVTKAPA